MKLHDCEINGWVRIAFKSRPHLFNVSEDTPHDFYALTTSLNFIVSLATGAGFGDVTAHNVVEQIMVYKPCKSYTCWLLEIYDAFLPISN